MDINFLLIVQLGFPVFVHVVAVFFYVHFAADCYGGGEGGAQCVNWCFS